MTMATAGAATKGTEKALATEITESRMPLSSAGSACSVAMSSVYSVAVPPVRAVALFPVCSVTVPPCAP